MSMRTPAAISVESVRRRSPLVVSHVILSIPCVWIALALLSGPVAKPAFSFLTAVGLFILGMGVVASRAKRHWSPHPLWMFVSFSAAYVVCQRAVSRIDVGSDLEIRLQWGAVVLCCAGFLAVLTGGRLRRDWGQGLAITVSLVLGLISLTYWSLAPTYDLDLMDRVVPMLKGVAELLLLMLVADHVASDDRVPWLGLFLGGVTTIGGLIGLVS